MKLNFTAKKIAEITGGELKTANEQLQVTSFVTDSRYVT